MDNGEYSLLPKEDIHLEDGKVSDRRTTSGYFLSKHLVLILLLCISFSLNVIFSHRQLRDQHGRIDRSRTIYGRRLDALLSDYDSTLKNSTAGLSRDVSVPFIIDRVYDSKNRSVADDAWKSPLLAPETGLVAMPDDWVTTKGLPIAQRFPWDNSKGLYVLNGFHNMHCLVSSRSSAQLSSC